MSKGPKWEREFCTDLSKWWTAGESDCVFWRTAGSGGRSTTRVKKGKSATKHCGDVCAIDPAGETLMKVFAIECKKGYNSHTLHALIDAPKKAGKQKFQEWIEQAEESRKNANSRFWLLVVKRDRRKALAVFDGELLAALSDVGSLWRLTLSLTFEKDARQVVAVPLDDFLAEITPAKVRALAGGRGS